VAKARIIRSADIREGEAEAWRNLRHERLKSLAKWILHSRESGLKCIRQSQQDGGGGNVKNVILRKQGQADTIDGSLGVKATVGDLP
jgi:hypothetical protein